MPFWIMFKRHSKADIAEAERQDWLRVRAGGRSRFIWRNQVPASLFVWFFVMLGLELLGDTSHRFSAYTFVLTCLITLPLVLLGGYLTGRWRWTELDKKFHE